MARPKRAMRRVRAALAGFLATEASGGAILLVASVAALIWANLLPGYEMVWHASLSLGPIAMDVRHWVNEGLMTVFFLVVGLEIKRELVVGELRAVRVAALPVAAAVGGMVGPALVYLAINTGSEAARGWAIPMATDIAFVVGALSLLGRRVPAGLKIFLLALAIVDDIGAIVVIALVYSGGLDLSWLAIAGLAVLGVIALRAMRAAQPLVYLMPGLVLWWAAFNAGIHPTLAGVALGVLIPARPIRDRYVLDELELRLHPISSFVIVPLFGLANAGVLLSAETIIGATTSSVFWGIAAGLFLGKGVGIFATSVAAERLRLARRPDDVHRAALAGGSVLAGIGFTVSLFITALAFESETLIAQAKIGVLAGSLLSGLVGALLLSRGRRHSSKRKGN